MKEKIVIIICNILLYTGIGCAQQQYSLKIDENWPKDVKEFYNYLNKSINMNGKEHDKMINNLSDKEIKNYTRILYNLSLYDPGFQFFTAIEFKKQLIKKCTNEDIYGKIKPDWAFASLRQKIQTTLTQDEFALLFADYVSVLRITDIESFDHYDVSGFRVEIIRVYGTVSEVIKGDLSIGKDVNFYYMKHWGSGPDMGQGPVPQFEINKKYLVLHHMFYCYDNEKDKCLSLTHSLGFEGGKWEITENDKLIDSYNFFKLGSMVTWTELKKTLNNKIEFLLNN